MTQDSLTRNFSTSPKSRLDGANILHDLSEMSNYADRIDCLLDASDQQQVQRQLRSISNGGQDQLESDDDDFDEDGEVD